MTNEIKEILEYLKDIKTYSRDEIGYYKDLYGSQIDVLLEYITNLHEEIERQEKSQVILDNQNAELQGRIDKAIEYIKEHCIDDDFYINLTNKEKHIFDVLNILQGEDNE